MPLLNRFVALNTFAAIAVIAGCGVNAETPAPVPAEEKADASGDSYTSIATLAGGCFWCTEAVFEAIEGVGDVESGYIGGHVKNPSYKAVCTGRTGHAEAVQVYYDPNKITFDEVLEIFFKTHDPTTLNRQGADAGTQYRSAIFYKDDEQKESAKKYIEKISKDYRSPIVTKLEKLDTWYPAEEYHQDYFRKNPYASYCQAVVSKKVRKTQNLFEDKLKPKK